MANFLFFVQGEGRGHLTQAITLQSMLERAGHRVCELLVGKNSTTKIPDFVLKKLHCPVTSFESPGFITDSKNKSIKLGKSIFANLANGKTFRKSLKFIREKINEHNPDVIINFYEPLIGIYYFFNNPKTPLACIAHQYIYNHPGFEFPVKGRSGDKFAIRLYTQLTALRAKKKFALSFYPINDNEKRSIIGTPPLLRQELFEQKIETKNFLLAYILKSGYMDEIIEWHKRNPSVELHCFTDKISEQEMVMHSPNLFFHKLNDKKFLEMMASAKGLVTTAGFESVCEAMYLGKPIMMVPVGGHFEQFSNAHDAEKTGAGIYDTEFNIDKLLNYIPLHKHNASSYRAWVDSAQEKVLHHLHELLAENKIAIAATPSFI